MSSSYFLKASLLLYFIATMHYLFFLVNRRKLVARVATISTICGFSIHSLAIILDLAMGKKPIISSFASISFFVWVMLLIYLIIENKYRIEVFGSFVLPVVFIASVLAELSPQDTERIFSSSTGILVAVQTVHILCIFIGYASFAFAFSMAMMYLIQEHQLKSKHPGALYFRLPSLDILERISNTCITVGFPLLTIAVISGIFWAGTTRASYWSWKPLEMWFMSTWVLYAILLQARHSVGWRGRRASYLAVFTFILSCLPLFGLV
jgi:ABC-type transport system involved in cytochrome c biogenesis permease subunit